MKQKLIRTLTLILFAGLITAFILYRSGYFMADTVPPVPVVKEVHIIQTDTTSKPDTSYNPEANALAKGLVIPKDTSSRKKAIVQSPKETDTAQLQQQKWDIEIMSSSKSIYIPRPQKGKPSFDTSTIESTEK